MLRLAWKVVIAPAVVLGLVGMGAVAISSLMPSAKFGSVVGVVRHSAFDDRGRVAASQRITRLEVQLDDGRLVRADSDLTRLPMPGQRITLTAFRSWLGYISYRWELSGP